MSEDKLLSQISDILESQTRRIEIKLENHTRRIEIKLENEVNKRIDTLFDGYKLTHEKQYELEREVSRLKGMPEDLQVRLAVLESKTA